MNRMLMILGVLAVAGCSAEPTKGSAPQAKEAEWKIEGTRIIGCCCLAPCPCRINKPPTHCHGCDGIVAVHIERGHIGPVKMDGVNYVLAARTLGEKTDGNWGYAYLSDRMSDEQVGALKAMLEGEIQAMGVKAKYIVGKLVGIRKVPVTFEISSDRREIGAVIPGIVEFRTRSIILPGHKTPATSAGIFDDFGDRFIHADALVNKYNDPQIGYKFDLTGRQANQADFVLDSIRAEQGGLGWGCWSAHQDFGTKDKYQEKAIDHP
jgi:hypothetical protein